jgi:hypothetical protein
VLLHNANQNGERICHMLGQEFYVNSEWAWLKANDGFARLRKLKPQAGAEHSGSTFPPSRFAAGKVSYPRGLAIRLAQATVQSNAGKNWAFRFIPLIPFIPSIHSRLAT